ncbi:hypothetical protein HY637_05775 [Candidatus Woesearchaeota archaeon]|nr:hypothetical protein [Candidatus Woesearchaeota archaeon]
MRLVFAVIAILLFLPHASFAEECDYKVQILIESPEFTKENFKWRMKAERISGKPTNITAIARIEDSSGNEVKSYNPWTSLPISRQKTSNKYSPNLAEGDYKIISEINMGCDDTNKTNNLDIKPVRIKSGNNENKTNLATDDKDKLTESNKEYENTINLLTQAKGGNVPLAGIADDTNKKYEYISSNEKAKNLAIYSLLGISIILGIILIGKGKHQL